MKYDELFSLSSNFKERDAATGDWKDNFLPPMLDKVLKDYPRDAELREKIERMLDADPIKRFYAAVLLWEVDTEKSKSVLETLPDDATPVKVQARLGFKVLETTIGILARDFLGEQRIRGDNFVREENLSNWATAVWSEKRKVKQEFDEKSLPKWRDVLDARENADKMRRLRIEIERLKNGDGVAERFYAAVLLDTIDEAESRKVLESLLTEKTKVGILHGDQMDDIPAYQVAEGLLNPQEYARTNEPANPIARATKWLEQNFFGKKSGD